MPSKPSFLTAPTLRVEWLLLLVLVWFVALGNGPWWTAVTMGRSAANPTTWLFVGSLFALLSGLHFFLLAMVCNRYTVKPLLIETHHIDPCFAYRMQQPGESDADYATRAAQALEDKILELGPDTGNSSPRNAQIAVVNPLAAI